MMRAATWAVVPPQMTRVPDSSINLARATSSWALSAGGPDHTVAETARRARMTTAVASSPG